jgi:hypothetical protein
MPDKQGKNRHKTATSWRKGQSGNAKGRPRSGFALSEVLRTFLDEPARAGDRKRLLVSRLFEAATAKDLSVAAAKLLIDTLSASTLEDRMAAIEKRLDLEEEARRAQQLH